MTDYQPLAIFIEPIVFQQDLEIIEVFCATSLVGTTEGCEIMLLRQEKQ